MDRQTIKRLFKRAASDHGIDTDCVLLVSVQHFLRPNSKGWYKVGLRLEQPSSVPTAVYEVSHDGDSVNQVTL